MRLTEYQPTEGGIPLVIVKDEQDALQKLAAYEDTGLTPETCKDIKSLCDDYVDAGLDASFILACIAAARAGISSKRMTEISKAETDNRLIILPCNVGDMVYRIHTKDHVEKHRVIAFHVSASGLWFWDENGRETPVEKIGKTVFFTRAEAEAALKGESRNGKKHE